MIPVDSQWIFHGKWLALKESQQGLIDPLLTIAKNSQNCWFIWIYSDLYWFIVIYMNLYWFIVIYMNLYWFIVIYCSYLDVPPNSFVTRLYSCIMTRLFCPCQLIPAHPNTLMEKPNPRQSHILVRHITGWVAAIHSFVVWCAHATDRH